MKTSTINKLFVHKCIPITSIYELDEYTKILKTALGSNWKSWKVTHWMNHLIWFPPKMSQKEFERQFTEWYNYKLKNWNPFD